MKALGIVLVSLLAVAGGIAAAAFIMKKRLEKKNEEDYYDDWDDIDWDDDDDDALGADFDVAEDVASVVEDIVEVNKENDELIEAESAAEEGEDL